MGGICRMGGFVMRSWNRMLFAGLILVGACNASHAAEYCVGTVAELNTALNDAASASSELFTTTVKLKTGTYNVSGTRFTLPNQAFFHALELLGGYNSDCSARVINPDNTILDANGASDFYFRPLNELLVEGIRFQNIGGSHTVDIWSAADDVPVSVRNNAFVGVGSFNVTGNDPDGDSVSGGAMKFVNNRVHGYPGFASVSAVYFADWSSIRFTGNTIADNQGEHGLYVCSSSSIWILDNIGWNNNGDDFRVYADCGDTDPGEARLRANLYQNVTYIPVSDSGENLVGVDPQFINPAAGNYRIQVTSPAVNTGVVSSSMASVDLAGNTRVVGSTVDMGAYETTVDDTIPLTLVVTNTSDSGPGSLRQAILDANTNEDFSYIDFNIPGNCPRVIVPASNLPTITNGVRINGWTQPESAPNTRTKGYNGVYCILLAGGGERSTGLQFGGTSTEQFWLQGLAFSGFSASGGTGSALLMTGGSGNLIWGNQFGGELNTANGTLMLPPNDTNIKLTSLSQSVVGGDLPAQRNVIADANGAGVLVDSFQFFASTGNEIIDNLIGSVGLEIEPYGNLTGIILRTSGNTVRNNTILNSDQDGLLMDVAAASDNIIQGNRIGIRDTLCFGTLCLGGPAGNGRDGINLFFGPHDNIIYNNVIKNNISRGVSIGSSAGGTSLRNWLVGNSLYANGAQGTFFNSYNGADNDADPAQQNMANRGLNYPVITRAYGGTRKGWVQGTLASTNGNYSIDLFSSAAPDAGFPRGEGEFFHRSAYGVSINNAPSGQNGNTSFRLSFPVAPISSLAGRVITVTAADFDGNTSEYSAPVAYECDVIFSHNLDDTLGDRCP